MIQIALMIAKQLGTAVGAAAMAALLRYLEKKSIIKHFKKKLDDLQSQLPDQEQK